MTKLERCDNVIGYREVHVDPVTMYYHRMDGPAVIWNSGRKVWWINGLNIDYEIRKWAEEMGIDLNNLSEDDKVLIAMKWSDYGK